MVEFVTTGEAGAADPSQGCGERVVVTFQLAVAIGQGHPQQIENFGIEPTGKTSIGQQANAGSLFGLCLQHIGQCLCGEDEQGHVDPLAGTAELFADPDQSVSGMFPGMRCEQHLDACSTHARALHVLWGFATSESAVLGPTRAITPELRKFPPEDPGQLTTLDAQQVIDVAAGHRRIGIAVDA